jgi:hypothetical protein
MSFAQGYKVLKEDDEPKFSKDGVSSWNLRGKPVQNGLNRTLLHGKAADQQNHEVELL